jgi:hypothetical protein
MSFKTKLQSISPTKKGFFLGLVFLLLTGLYLLIRAVLNYNGGCGTALFFGGYYDCTPAEYFFLNLKWIPLLLLLGWQYVLTIIFVPTIIGFIIGKIKNKSS